MRSFVAALCAAGVMMAAGAAQATVATLTFDGTVASGIDQLGLFGAAGTDVTGDAFSAFFQFNDAFNNAGRNEAQGGTSLMPTPRPNPTLAATLTINGATLTLPDLDAVESFFGDYLASAPGDLRGLAEAFEGGSNGQVFLSIAGHNPTLTGSTLSITNDPTLPSQIGFLRLSGMTQSIELNATSATVSPISAPVPGPEPATWAMLVAGFGGIGGMLRRRRAGNLVRA